MQAEAGPRAGAGLRCGEGVTGAQGSSGGAVDPGTTGGCAAQPPVCVTPAMPSVVTKVFSSRLNELFFYLV